MKAMNFDAHFDKGANVLPHADITKAERPNRMKRVNVDFPIWMVDALDKEAKHIGVIRQSLVKIWIAHCLSNEAHTTQSIEFKQTHPFTQP